MVMLQEQAKDQVKTIHKRRHQSMRRGLLNDEFTNKAYPVKVMTKGGGA